jgi:Flp pilus assembly protein CpaB
MSTGKLAILGSLAVLGGCVTAYLVQDSFVQWLVERDKVPVLVARRELMAGLVLREPDDWLEAKRLPRSAVPAKATIACDDVRDMQLVRSLAAGEPCSAADFVACAAFRACSLPVIIDQDIACFLSQGSFVDVLGTVPSSDGMVRHKHLLSSVRVLAVRQGHPGVITVALTSAQAEKLAQTHGKGPLTVILNSGGLPSMKTDGARSPFESPTK